MELTDDQFLKNIFEQFETTDRSEITLETNFKELEEWDSMIALSFIAMADDVYGIRLTGDDIRNSNTLNDLFNCFKAKTK